MTHHWGQGPRFDSTHRLVIDDPYVVCDNCGRRAIGVTKRGRVKDWMIHRLVPAGWSVVGHVEHYCNHCQGEP